MAKTAVLFKSDMQRVIGFNEPKRRLDYVFLSAWLDAYSVKHIAYTWMEGPRDSVGIDRTVQLPQFSIKGYRTKNKLEILTTGQSPFISSWPARNLLRWRPSIGDRTRW